MTSIKSTPTVCLYKNKQADQLRGFPTIDITISQLSVMTISDCSIVGIGLGDRFCLFWCHLLCFHFLCV